MSGYSLMIHGGAGVIRNPERFEPSLQRIVSAGADLLERGGTARDAVSLCVTLLEDDPLYNAGFGSVLNADGVAECDAAILTLADQPFVTTEKLNTLIAEHLINGHGIVTSEYADTVGVPVLFSRDYFDQLLALKPDQGCKGVILRNTTSALRIATPEAELDVDTPEDYERLAAMVR